MISFEIITMDYMFQHKPPPLPPPLGSGGGLCKKILHVPPPLPHSPT